VFLLLVYQPRSDRMDNELQLDAPGAHMYVFINAIKLIYSMLIGLKSDTQDPQVGRDKALK
jgi:hypothetical protein